MSMRFNMNDIPPKGKTRDDIFQSRGPGVGVRSVVMLICSCQALMKKEVRVLSFSRRAVGKAIAQQYCEVSLVQ